MYLNLFCVFPHGLQNCKQFSSDMIYVYLACLRMDCKTVLISSRFLLALMWDPILFFKNLRHLLSLEIRNNSIDRFSYGEKPVTSRTKSRTNLLWLVCLPLLCEGFLLTSLRVVL